MSRVRRTGLLGLLVTGVTALSLCLAVPGAHAAPDGATAPGAVADFASCLNGRHAGDLLLLVDQSGSLRQSDPEGQRVKASKYLVRSLAPQLERTNIDLSVAVAGFDATYQQVRDWTSLRGGGATQVTAAIDKLTPRNTGFETDYWTAMDGARAALAQRAGGGQRCQAIVFFTDGELAISQRGSADERRRYEARKPYYNHDIVTDDDAKKAQRAASKDLCRPTGLMNALRANGVKTFAIGLSAAGQSPDFGLLESMATGRGGPQPCGQITSPSPGTFQRATDIDSLLFDFDQLLGPSIQITKPVCQHRDHCDAHRFILDNSIGTVHILATSPVEGVTVELRPPASAAPVELTTTTSTLHPVAGDPAISYSWNDQKSVVLDLARPQSAGQPWTGEWALTFIDTTGSSPDAISRSNIHISSDIVPAWPKAASTAVRSGETVKGVVLGLENAAGDLVAPTSLLGQAALSAALVDAQGKVVRSIADHVDKSQIDRPRDLDLSGATPGPAALRLSLEITTKALPGRVGTKLSPATRDVPLTVLPPFNYPKVASPLSFGTFTGATHKQGHLSVTGPGCVWVPAGAALQLDGAPAEVGSVTASSDHAARDACLKVAAGTTAGLTVTLANQHQGKGDLSAKLSVLTAPLAADGAPIAVPVTVTGTFEHRIKKSNFLLGLLVALLLGLGLPALMVFIQKRLESRIPSGTLAFERFPVRVSAGSVTRNGGPLTLQDTDFVRKRVEILNGSRTVPVEDLLLRARSTPTPGAPPYVLATTAGRVLASSQPVNPSTKDLAGRLPLNVRNNWVVLHDPAGPADQAELLLLVGADADRDGRRKLVEDAAARLPRVLASLRQQAEQDGPAPASPDGLPPAHDPWSSATPSAAVQPNPWDSAPSGNRAPQQHHQQAPTPPAEQQPPPPPPRVNDDPWGLGGSR